MNTKEPSSLMERHNMIIAEILKRFTNMVMAATAPLPKEGNIVEKAAINRMTMENESNALIAECEKLFALNREIKYLWMRGPLRQPGEDDGREAALDQKAQQVAGLYDRVLGMRDAAVSTQAAQRAQGAGVGSTSSAAASTSAAAPPPPRSDADALNGNP
ncbi:hypothetical protein F4819DRAFT_131550 [Hypoxylon fuscum]|nr:hypothetical protein F4819DRAFT_131550 [Hypoxylon fuscum]